MKDQFNSLLNKKMDRKDFLKYFAAAGLMAFGGNAIVQSIMGANKLVSKNEKKLQNSKTFAQGYGGSAYGGKSS